MVISVFENQPKFDDRPASFQLGEGAGLMIFVGLGRIGVGRIRTRVRNQRFKDD